MGKNRSTYSCRNCGKPAYEVFGNYPFHESGLTNVVLKGMRILTCDECGNRDPIIPKANDLMAALASSIVKKPCSLTGEEIRFLRKHIGMNGETFATFVGVDKTTLSKWENNQISIGTTSDRLIRILVAARVPEPQLDEIREVINGFAVLADGHKAVRIELDVQSMAVNYA